MAQSLEQYVNWLGKNVQGDLGPLTFYTSKQGHLVYFPRAPPKEPASYEQGIERDKFRAAAAAWRELSFESKRAWRLLSKAAYLRITGYNLFTYWQVTGDFSVVSTLIRRTGIDPLNP